MKTKQAEVAAVVILFVTSFALVTSHPVSKRGASLASSVTRTVQLQLPIGHASPVNSASDLMYVLMAEFPSPSRSSGPYMERASSFDQFVNDELKGTEAARNTLYFSQIPHKELVLKNEEIREQNGLARHLLESIRPFHPFYVDY